MPHTLLIEFDRTRRIDKNFEKFRRYDTFLVWWWNWMEEALHAPVPYVIFVCQDEDQLDQFLHAADYKLTGHHDCLDYNRDRFVGRNRILFAVEQDMHAGRLDAWRVPAVPRDHLNRDKHSRVRSVGLTAGSCTGPRAWFTLVLISTCWASWRWSLEITTPLPRPRAEMPHHAWTFEEGGSTASRWTPLPRPTKRNGRAAQE